MMRTEDQLFGQKTLSNSQIALKHAQKVAGAHGLFLETRHQSLQQIADLLEAQIDAGRRTEKRPQNEKPVLLSMHQLDEFARGSLVACLGEDYKVFAGRRTPRIPNGDLMLISRVLEIVGRRGELNQPSKIYAEYDVPADAWFFRDNSYSSIPLSILMEIALQPCGVLSAYMGTMLLFPDHEFYFRNLDGQSTILRETDLRGRTISCQATMTSSIVSGETIIQKFSFALSCDGEGFYQGESVFGYFPPQMMANQAGLDGGKQVFPWHEESGSKVNESFGFVAGDVSKTVQKFYKQPSDHLNLIGKQLISVDGGHFGKGYVFASDRIDPNDWFYTCHFFQDPVMPGSLGVEAMVQAMQTLVLEKKLSSGMRSPRFTLEVGQPMVWKYRGQITPTNQMMSLEVHIQDIHRETDKIRVRGNASLWADQKRIYEVRDLTVCIIDEG